MTLSELKGSPVVLYLYPKDDTSGCTKEAFTFRDSYAEYEKAGAKLLGVSPDFGGIAHQVHQEVRAPLHPPGRHRDPRSASPLGVWKEKSMYGRKYMGVERTTFVIDAKGIVHQIFPKVKVDGHSEQVLEAVKACK